MHEHTILQLKKELRLSEKLVRSMVESVEGGSELDYNRGYMTERERPGPFQHYRINTTRRIETQAVKKHL